MNYKNDIEYVNVDIELYTRFNDYRKGNYGERP